ncbi:unnamed protein product [Periconia digitata]|uniref:Uncharacterized protein n=1 Tax=Periconia digitata TaxID=1303443 RepID=A0A9W4URY6_9PLEO|nr:unnamed protein product [Periconia digitata]
MILSNTASHTSVHIRLKVDMDIDLTMLNILLILISPEMRLCCFEIQLELGRENCAIVPGDVYLA